MQFTKGDIQNYSPTVMFRGTPCILINNQRIRDNIQIVFDLKDKVFMREHAITFQKSWN